MKIGPFYIIRDTGIPGDLPPRSRDELVNYRLAYWDAVTEIARLTGEIGRRAYHATEAEAARNERLALERWSGRIIR